MIEKKMAQMVPDSDLGRDTDNVRGICRVYLQGGNMNQARNLLEEDGKHSFASTGYMASYPRRQKVLFYYSTLSSLSYKLHL
jgi:hypothetical protein